MTEQIETSSLSSSSRAYRNLIETCRTQATRHLYTKGLRYFMNYLRLPNGSYDKLCIYVDAANPEVWESLKREFNEPYNQKYISDQTAECKKLNSHIENRMIVVPVPFGVEGAKMLQHAKALMDET